MCKGRDTSETSNDREKDTTMRKELSCENAPLGMMAGDVPHSRGTNGARPCKSGSVFLRYPQTGGRSRRVPVVLSLYCGTFDRYAVVSQDRLMCKDCGYINLRHSAVSRLDSSNNSSSNEELSFQIIPTKCDGQSVVFSVGHRRDLDDWLEALTPDASEYSPPAPVLRRPVESLSKRPRPVSVIGKHSSLPALLEEEWGLV